MGKAPQAIILPWNSIPLGVVGSPLEVILVPAMSRRPKY